MTTVLKKCRYAHFLFNPEDMFIGSALAIYGEYGEYEVNTLLNILPKGGVAVDVGANIGCITVPLSHKAGSVVAIEPQRVTFQHLCGNVAMTGNRNVHAIHAGAGSYDGFMRIKPIEWDGKANNGGYALEPASEGEQVRIIRIDSMGLSKCDLIKVDVEGWESEVLQGAEETIRKFRPALYVEAEKDDKTPALIEQLFSYGYRAWWHFPPLFNEHNFEGVKENAYPDTISINLLCLPDGKEPPWPDGIEAKSGDTFHGVRDRYAPKVS